MKRPILVILLTLILFGFSSETRFPVPPHNTNTLFYIQRSNNSNTVMYEVNRSEKNIDSNDPVQVYWIRYAEKGQKQGLNYLERTLAYGVRCEKTVNGKFLLHFVASKKKWAEILLDEKGQASAYMFVGKKMSQLQKIFVQVTETGWLPKVQYVEFFGNDVKTHEPTYEKMPI